MDLPTDHFIAQDTSYVSDRKKFCKGVAVFEIPAASGTQGKAATDKSPPGDPARVLELGSLYVSERDVPKCHICNMQGHKRDACPQRKASQKCRNCGETGHLKRDCPRVKCNNCGAEGHMRQECEQPTKKRRRSRAGCLNCGSPDHKSRDCKETCHNCGIPGHVLEDCMPGPTAAPPPVAPATPGGHDLMDTSTEAGPSTAPADSHDVPDAEPAGRAEDNESQASTDHSPMDEPHDALTLPSEDLLTVQFEMQIVREHITSCGVRFFASYTSDDTPSGRAHTTAAVRFTNANIDGIVSIESTEAESREVQRLLRPETLKRHQDILSSLQDTELKLYHIQLTFDSSKTKAGDRPGGLLGEYFYANGEFGPFTQELHATQNMLLEDGKVTVHFFTLATEWLVGHIGDVNESLSEQAENNPILSWYPQRNPNIQRGMELKPEVRPSYQIPPRYQFDNTLEYFTVHFYSTIASLETDDAGENPRVETVLRLLSFPGGGDRIFFAAIQMAQGLSLRTDSTIDVSFLGEDADSTTDWSGHVIHALPFVSGYDFWSCVRKPRVGGGFTKLPDIAPDVVIDSRDYRTVGDLSAALIEKKGIRSHVRERIPKVGTHREINTLRHLWQNRPAFATELQVLLANDFTSLPKVDYFDADIDKYGSDAVDAARRSILPQLDSQQQHSLEKLRSMTGGYLLIQGPGGVGKSTLLKQLIMYQYRVGALSKDPCGIWVISPLNQQLDGLAQGIYAMLKAEYDEQKAKGLDPKFPVVIRRYMRETEIKIYLQDALVQRKEAGFDKTPEYFNKAEAEAEAMEEDASKLGMALLLYRTFENCYATGFDKRLRNPELSEGQWVLRRAGVPDANGQLHPIADPDRYTEFRERLRKFTIGEATDPQDKSQLTLAANAIVADLAKMADAILMTPDVVSQTRAHSISRARAVLHDEAGKALETGSLAGIVWSRPYTTIEGPTKIEPVPPVPQVLFGDIYQPRPMLGPGTRRNFHEQRQVSLFARLLKAGADTVWFWQQHRFNRDIADLVNSVLPHGRLSIAEGIQDRETCKQAVEFFKKTFGVDRTVAFLSTDSTMEVNTFSKSTFNVAHAQRAFYVALALLEFGVKPEQIGLGVPYVAQLNLYTAGRHALVEWCSNHQDPDKPYQKLAPEVDKIQVFTIDGIQGSEVEYLIYDTVIAGNLKFLRDTARNLLALTRARAGLIIIGNVSAVQAYYSGKNRMFSNTAYYKVVKWCKENGVFINLERRNKKRTYDKLKAPFNISDVVERVHRQREADNNPISYSMDQEFDIHLPDFANDEADTGGAGDDANVWGGIADTGVAGTGGAEDSTLGEVVWNGGIGDGNNLRGGDEDIDGWGKDKGEDKGEHEHEWAVNQDDSGGVSNW